MVEVDSPWSLKEQNYNHVCVTTVPVTELFSDSPFLVVDFYENYTFISEDYGWESISAGEVGRETYGRAL